MNAYVHGYEPREGRRLDDQAGALAELLHADSVFAAGDRVLEIGCGVGSQTITLARQNPGAHIVSIDRSGESLATARARIAEAGLVNVSFEQADLFDLPFPAGSFDHVFACFVLEHLADPVAALRIASDMLRPGGNLTVIEGDHGSAYFHPDSSAARAAIGCQVELQRRAGGDALIGRRVYPLVVSAGFADVRVRPLLVYVDGSRPDLAQAFTRDTFTAMIEGVRADAVAGDLASPEAFDAGVRDLYRTSEPDGTFSYTFFRATAIRGTIEG
jgi:SAM-dependent methyltransferase